MASEDKINYIRYTHTNNLNKKKIEAQTKLLITTVIERCKKETLRRSLAVPLAQYEERASYYTGVPHTFIQSLEKEQMEIETLKSLFIQVRDNINIHIYEHLVLLSKPPTFLDLYSKIGNISVVAITDEHMLKQIMIEMDYKIVKLANSDAELIIENPEIKFERYLYLKKMIRHRSQNSPIYFIDAFYVTNEGRFERLKDLSIGNNLIFFNMISKSGYENGFFCSNTTPDDYLKWIIDTVVPILKPSSVIILDGNNPFNQIRDVKITSYSSKKDMLTWLKKNDIPCNATMHKAELYHLIENCSIKNEEYLCEKIFKAHGHDVLRLPKNYPDLALSELLRKNVGRLILSRPSTLNDKALDIVASLPYSEYDKTIEDKEAKVMRFDSQMEDALEKFEIDINLITDSKKCFCKMSFEIE